MQTTLDHWYIKQHFNATPRIGWQINPFSQSDIPADLLGEEEFKLDLNLSFAHIDYQDQAKRTDEKKLEVIRRGSKTYGPSS